MDEEWMKENKAFLSRQEGEFLKVIDILNKYKTDRGSVVDLTNYELSENNREKLKFMFDEMEKLLDEQKQELLKVKRLYKLEE
ncbi:hypothetical protein [Flavobacterium sp. N502536]|uniref:hypothetical protein n=1 Tax=Flavobacterium sp. N502536 TaxID=2986837 RepID=UPI00222291DB|nr:hypothetical protein [Flavobacterium sp. N502536]